MSRQAGWRTRQAARINNCGKQTVVMMWMSVDSDAFHIVEKVKEVGAQERTLFESILSHKEALSEYTTRTTQALIEEVVPPNPGRQIVGVIDGDNDE